MQPQPDAKIVASCCTGAHLAVAPVQHDLVHSRMAKSVESLRTNEPRSAWAFALAKRLRANELSPAMRCPTLCSGGSKGVGSLCS
jgi:hypothetical protein